MRLAGLALFLAAPVLFLAAVGCASTAPPPAEDHADSGARDLYANKCTACHRLHRPSEYSKAKWPAILDRMSVKAKLTPEEDQELRDYLLGHARP